MATHVYTCERGGPLVVATDGVAPRWVTCPAGTDVDCERCNGAELQRAAPEFAGGSSALYRCPAKHELTLRTPSGRAVPESAECPVCKGIMVTAPRG